MNKSNENSSVDLMKKAKCRKCGKTLFFYDIKIGRVQIQCKNCKTLTDVTGIRGIN